MESILFKLHTSDTFMNVAALENPRSFERLRSFLNNCDLICGPVLFTHSSFRKSTTQGRKKISNVMMTSLFIFAKFLVCCYLSIILLM